jgi:peptide-methionine (S)-S-oxide reductase
MKLSSVRSFKPLYDALLRHRVPSMNLRNDEKDARAGPLSTTTCGMRGTSNLLPQAYTLLDCCPGVFIMRAVLIAFLILAGVSVLAWATAKPNDGRANAKAPFPKPAVDAQLVSVKGKESAVLSGGCFWGIQAVFQHLKGVVSATSGYSGGEASTAHYEDVSTGSTGHAESVKIAFDPSQISYGQILMIFFSVAHNPTELNYQGPDHGTQYRSSIFFSNDQQKKIAEAYIAQLGAARIYSQSIVTQVVPLKSFYPAEDYHQDYLKHHSYEPYVMINDLPKLASLKKEFPELYKND